MKDRIVLASASPRRKELLEMLGFTAEIMPSHVDETVDEELQPWQIVEELSLRKASSVLDNLDIEEMKNGIVIGSDTIVVLNGIILGKPANHAEARAMLHKLQGKTHEVYTGVACVRFRAAANARSEHANSFISAEPATDSSNVMRYGDIGEYRVLSKNPDSAPDVITGHTVSKVTFRSMTDSEIEEYVRTGEPLDKAGSYGVQGFGALFVEKIEGDFYSVMGLPVNLLYEILSAYDISPFKHR